MACGNYNVYAQISLTLPSAAICFYHGLDLLVAEDGALVITEDGRLIQVE